MNSQFEHVFWDYYIASLVVLAIVALSWLLWSQTSHHKPDENATKHHWDGIEKRDEPMPRWWFYSFVLLMIWAAGYLIAYPGLGSFQGVLGWSSQRQYQQEVEQAQIEFGGLYQRYAHWPASEVAQDAQAMQMGQSLFQNYCIQCHGVAGQGMANFPNLTDAHWQWGGSAEEIRQSIQEGRTGVMPPYGDILSTEQIQATAHYVRSLSANAVKINAGLAAQGQVIFQGHLGSCATCHGPQGEGVVHLGPSLRDAEWLWGQDEAAIINTITHGRTNHMPAWNDFLSDDKLHVLSAYVWQLTPTQQRIDKD